jgi:succinoglycan biosynthesis transport protein ExoP
MGSLSKADQMLDEPNQSRMVSTPDSSALAPLRPTDSPNELWEWLRLLNRRKALIVGCGLIATALMALMLAQATPLYKATARIMLDTRTFKVVSTEAALSGVDTLNMGAIQSELEVIQSEFLIGRVVDKLGLANNPEFNGTKPPGFIDNALQPLRDLWSTGISTLLAPPPKPQQASAQPQRAGRPAEDSDPRRRAAIGAVAGRLSVSLLGRTFVILVTVESPDGTMSARIANAIAEAYLADQVDNKNEANRRALRNGSSSVWPSCAAICRSPKRRSPPTGVTRASLVAPRARFRRRRWPTSTIAIPPPRPAVSSGKGVWSR